MMNKLLQILTSKVLIFTLVIITGLFVLNLCKNIFLHTTTYLYANYSYHYDNDKYTDQMVEFNTKDLPVSISQESFLNVKSAIDNNELDGISLVVIKNHKAKFISPNNSEAIKFKLENILNFLKRTQAIKLINNTVFAIKPGDYITDQEFERFVNNEKFGNVPIVGFAADTDLIQKYPGRVLLIPDDYTLGNGNKKGYWRGWKIFAQEVDSSRSLYPWDQKINKIFWRGKLADCSYPHCENSGRLKLVQLGEKYDFIDAKFASLIASDKKLYTDWGLGHVFVEFTNPTEQNKYKYPIVTDGVSVTAPGYLYRLYSGSVTLKQETTHIQWFYSQLRPYIHYVPVKKDMSDIKEVY
ncbi:MAG: glycosyl transferase family 90, partial [Rickettsiaceae bacterium]|nr:glycosyl transferase family 90 [Rickettsiaceae bacterium]